MARKKVEGEAKEVGQEGNIKDVPGLTKAFMNDKIEPRKLVALRNKLTSLFREEKITEEEQVLMERILKKDRVKGTIFSTDNYLLNTIESERCEHTCIVKVDDGPATHHMVKDLKCKFEKDFDRDKFNVYVPRTVPTEHQIPPEIAYKRLNNYPVDPNDLPRPRILIHRLVLTQREFSAWFDVIEEEVDFGATGEEKEEEFTF